MDNRFFYQSGLISFGIYISFLLFLIIYFNYARNTSKAYSFRQETFFEISLHNIEKTKDKADLEVKKDKASLANEQKIIKEDGSLTHKRGADFKSLFDNMKDDNTDSKLNEYNLKTSKSMQISRKYGQKSKEVSDELNNIDKALEQMKLPTAYINNANYNKYYSKISKLLTVEFNRKITIKGEHESVVLITIDDQGSFSYKVNKKSHNDFFNSKLEEFLQEIKTRTFPPYENGSTVMKVIFKIEE